MKNVTAQDQPGEELRSEAGAVQLFVLRVEAGLHLTLAAEHLDQRVTAEGLLDLPLSRPVCVHWAMNRRFERLAICRVTSITSGIVTKAIDASSGEIDTIIATTPITVSVEINSWLSVCAGSAGCCRCRWWLG